MDTLAQPPAHRVSKWPIVPAQTVALVAAALLILLLAWLVVTAPPSSLRARGGDAGLDLLAADGTAFAHRGPHTVQPVDVARLPANVRNAFLAIEDRRFYKHGSVDLKGLARAAWHNARAGSVVEGGSTITQQYVKNAWLRSDRTVARKLQEFLLAGWLETWLRKDEIFGRYLATIYFGDQAYGLDMAAQHYFGKSPEQLSLSQAAMLAGLVKAPSRLAPTRNPSAAADRMRVVLAAMAHAGFITAAQAATAPVPRTMNDTTADVPGGWFGDWLLPMLPGSRHGGVRTTLDLPLQRRAEAVIAGAPLGGAEVALVAMRPDGAVVAMVGGRHYSPGGFNRATQARRQPGSTFKLFDYLAAFRSGARPDDLVLDAPLQIGTWAPTNAYRGYYGPMHLRDAFALSSNLAAVRVSESVGREQVIRAARDLGVSSPLPDTPSLALGTATMPLIELAGAYAAFAGGRYPVVPHGLAEPLVPPHQLEMESERAPMLDLLWQAANVGTGRIAALSQPTYGKTGTSQDGRDAFFVGFAGDLLTAVWVGRDDNAPVPGLTGGHLPAEIWHAFMSGVALHRFSWPEQPVRAPSMLLTRGARPASPLLWPSPSMTLAKRNADESEPVNDTAADDTNSMEEATPDEAYGRPHGRHHRRHRHYHHRGRHHHHR